MSTDDELWRRSLDGESSAFGQLFERHAQAVFGYCLRRTASWTAAEDLVSVVFLEAWRRRAAMVPHGTSVLPWLYGIALGVTRNHRRALGRYRAALQRFPPADAAADHAEAVAERVDAERRAAAVHRHLAGLARRDRDVVEACVWLGLTHSEAATMLGIPIGTVKSRLARAHRQLRAGLLSDPDLAGPDPDRNLPAPRPEESRGPEPAPTRPAAVAGLQRPGQA